MKLSKEFITPNDVMPPPPEFIMESTDREKLKRKAEALAREEYELLEFMWGFEGNDTGYTELTVENQCRFVIKP